MSQYGCFNLPPPVACMPLRVQDGWYDCDGTRMPRMITVPFVMSTVCNYDKRATDKNCSGCNRAVLD